VGSLAAGVLVLVWAGITIHALAIVAGISMVLGGLGRLATAIRTRGADRAVAALTGFASVAFGALALSWPDVTVLVLALLFGARTVIFGLQQIAAAVSQRPHGGGRRRARSSPQWLRVAGAAASVVLALGLLAGSAEIHRSSASAPDAFYNAPSGIPAAPGVLLRSEPYTAGIPDDWRAWRILYTTTRAPNVPAVASGLVIVSKHPPAGPRPVIAWAHGTTGVASSCAPSLLSESRLNNGVIPGLDRLIGRGWVLVATDYVGLGTAGPHPYLIGQGEARSVLDSVRAARQLPDLELAHETVVWGHSQGGHAALWVGMLAPTYAPDVNVVGVAALAPASDLLALVDTIRHTLEGRVLSAYIMTAYSQNYADVSFDHYVRPAARVQVREAAKRCLDLPDAIPSVLTALLSRQPIYAVDPLAGALGRRLAENTPREPIKAPLLIAQGDADPLVLPSVQRAYVNQRCHAGQRVEYVTYRNRDHLSLLWSNSPLVPFLLAWSEARFAERPVENRCTVASR
jgi:uncharacterized membrane protein HdeD (DUF308 family)/alpha-beta hydrolase superfamily lysophospholipase